MITGVSQGSIRSARFALSPAMSRGRIADHHWQSASCATTR
jgi:hypothetical protein